MEISQFDLDFASQLLPVSTLNAMGTGVIVCEAPGGRIIYSNKTAETLLGHPIHKTENTADFQSFGGVHADGRPYKPEEYPNGRAILNGETVTDHDMRYKGPDGTMRWLRVCAIPVRDSKGEVKFSVCSFHDISNEKKLEEDLKSVNEELKRSNSELTRFAGVAAHDLKSPLNTVSSVLELLAMELSNGTPQPANEYINLMSKATDRARNLIDQLLSYSQVGGAKHNQWRDVNLNEAFDSALENLNAEIVANQASVIRDELPTVPGIETDLIQLFQNLVSNSIKYRRSERTRISLTTAQEDGRLIFIYRDNGQGIRREDLSSIFEPFKRSAQNQAIVGSGLGLSICARIVQKHGGTIKVESELGEGSIFKFTLTTYLIEPT